jgi:hypothetical protein
VPRPINNYTTQNAYTDAGTCIFDPAVQAFEVIVTTAVVFYQLRLSHPGVRAEGEPWGLEYALPPKSASFGAQDSVGLGGDGGLRGIRFRSFVAGTPAQVFVLG